ncbi:hypothetical protein [Paraburkholderia sartisoli]|uniref:Uncharacterized protein n=1 Tax=Paraburkholderia sartisoli TaxID=83784 RepID=A0A1H4HSE4_9BURK|nr:hypothetical protein [Paraburkholderia sartisoli]SEB24743.1 hypothetical protein SAMN05192564_1155 [Paraburkholderia sartisoli]
MNEAELLAVIRKLITYMPDYLTPDQRLRRLQEINVLAAEALSQPRNRRPAS